MLFRGNHIVLAECDRCGHATTLAYAIVQHLFQVTLGQNRQTDVNLVQPVVKVCRLR